MTSGCPSSLQHRMLLCRARPALSKWIWSIFPCLVLTQDPTRLSPATPGEQTQTRKINGWNLRIDHWKWKSSSKLQTIIFRFYVNLRGCNHGGLEDDVPFHFFSNRWVLGSSRWFFWGVHPRKQTAETRTTSPSRFLSVKAREFPEKRSKPFWIFWHATMLVGSPASMALCNPHSTV